MLLHLIIRQLKFNIMYIVIKRDKAEHMKEKLHKAKRVIEEAMECIEEASEQHEDYRSRARGYDRYEDDYEERDIARGRGSRGRY